MIFIGVVLHIGLFIAILIAIGNWHDKKHAREVAALEAQRAAKAATKTKVRYSRPKVETPEPVTEKASDLSTSTGFDSWLD